MPVQMNVRLTGFGRALRAIELSDEIAYKEIVKAMRSAAQDVAREAQSLLPDQPVSGWGSPSIWDGRNLGYNLSTAKSRLRTRQAKFNKRGIGSLGYAMQVVEGDPGAAAWMVIGSGQRVKTPQGATLVQAINDRYGTSRWKYGGQGPRALVEAYYAARPADFEDEIAAKIEQALRKAGLD